MVPRGTRLLELSFHLLELVGIAQSEHRHQVKLTFGRGRPPGLNIRQGMVPGEGDWLLRLGASAEQQLDDRDEDEQHT
jgi:hypothetical protein